MYTIRAHLNMPNAETLHRIKDGIRKNHAIILDKWTNRVPNRPPNLSELLTYLVDQHNLAGTEMMKLMIAVFSFIDHRSMHAFGKDFRDVAQRIVDELGGRKFYLIMDCGSQNAFGLGGEQTELREEKSNYFMFIMLMCIRPNLLDQLVDFVCRSDTQMIPVHHENVDKSVTVFVYMDDVSFTGIQAVHNTAWIEKHPNVHLIYGSVYASDEALSYIEKQTLEDFSSVELITSDSKLRPVTDKLVTEKYLSITSTPMADELRKKAFLSLEMLPGEEKYLFFTDLKIPDELSMFRGVLPTTRLVDVNGKLEGEYMVSGMYSRYRRGRKYDSEIGRWYNIIDEKEQQSPEVYKTESWMDFLKELKGSRKRDRYGNLID